MESNWYFWMIRAITSASENFCKIEKCSTFAHFGPKKHPHQWVQNCAFMHNCYTNRAICTVTVALA